jgi:hypothetical protein
VVDPELGYLFLRSVLGETRAKAAEIHVIERLILVKAREYYSFFACDRVLVHLEALGADFLHHALHRGVDAADRVVIWFQVWPQDGMPCLLDGFHHAIRADYDQAVYRIEGNGDFAELSAAVGGHGFHNIAYKGDVLDAAGCEAGGLIANPDDQVGGFFDFFDFIPVDDLFVAGEVDDTGTFFAEFLTDGE